MAPLRNMLVSVGLLAAALCLPAAGQQVELRLMTYNIYYGGHDHDPILNRGLEWLDVIRSRNPDVLLIQEATGWLPEEEDYLSAYVDSLNQSFPGEPPYAGYIGEANSQFNVALISRVPVVAFQAVTGRVVSGEVIILRNVIIHAELDAWGEPLHVFGVHFKAGYDSREQREREARVLLAMLDDLPPHEPVWIGGDFNSYSPVDIAPGSLTPPDYQHGAGQAEQVGWEPVGYLLDRDYVDLFRTLHPAVLGYTQETEAFLPNTLGPIRRIDFLICSPPGPWAATMAEVVADSLGHIGSDHYAVCADLQRQSQEQAGAWTRPADIELSGGPSPCAGVWDVALRLRAPAPLELTLHSPDGRCRRVLFRGPAAAGVRSFRWDGRDDAGRPVAAGLYFLRCRAGGITRVLRLLRSPR
jgi:endonuclease/exonuclease/phosphatase family metal-dependent hydrolase